MNKDIIFCGVGGQGVLSVASLFINAANDVGLHVKQTEIHGMAQRGGAVTSQVRVSDDPIHSPIIALGTADFIVASEPMEALRQVSFLAKEGCIISSMTPMKNIAYPDIEEVHGQIKDFKNNKLIDTAKICEEISNLRAANIILLGSLVAELNIEGLSDAIQTRIKIAFAKKGEKIVESNLLGFAKGLE
ncbi:MAG: indolepyruvate oxidoreductase subunit beta [bacterium]